MSRIERYREIAELATELVDAEEQLLAAEALRKERLATASELEHAKADARWAKTEYARDRILEMLRVTIEEAGLIEQGGPCTRK